MSAKGHEYELNDRVRYRLNWQHTGRIVRKANRYGTLVYGVEWDNGKTSLYSAMDLEPEPIPDDPAYGIPGGVPNKPRISVGDIVYHMYEDLGEGYVYDLNPNDGLSVGWKSGKRTITPSSWLVLTGDPNAFLTPSGRSVILAAPVGVTSDPQTGSRTYLYQSDYPLMLTPYDTDVDGLIRAVIELRNAWRADNQVFSVRVMGAVGMIVSEAERALDFGSE